MKQVHLKKKNTNYKIKRRTFFLVSILLVFLGIIITFNIIGTKVSPVLLNYAELETRKIASIIINKAISKQITEENNIDELFIITKNNNDLIQTIDFNTALVNRFLVNITNTVQLNLKYVEQGDITLYELSDDVTIDYDKDKNKDGIVFKIPSGIVFNNPILTNLGPKIPVRLNLVGDIISNVETKITNYGINNALLEVSVKIVINEQVILPFISKKILIETSAPIAIKLTQGVVPNYYFNGMSQNSPILSVPIE